MNLIGKSIKHKMLGGGIVTAQENGILTIDFPTKTSRFPYTEANFTKFLTLEDPILQSAVLKEFEDLKKFEKEKILEKQAETTDKKESLSVKKTPPKISTPKKMIVAQQRISGKPMTFYVFQGNTFDRESRGGYIWAPISNKAGNTFHHWDRLLDVQPGDIIFHGYNAHIQAVSVARGMCYECNQPEELRTEDLWDQEGRRVDCDYFVLDHPIKTSHYTDDILRLCNVKYAPFDKYGNGNMGYLYNLDPELARIFMHGIVKRNPDIANVEYVVDLLD